MTTEEKLQLCLESLRAGQLAQVEALGRDLARDAPGDARTWQVLGFLAVAQARLADAVDLFARSLRITPGVPDVLYQQAVIQYRLRRHQQAIATLDTLLALVPAHAAAWFMRARILFETGRYQPALDSFDHALALDSTRPGAHAWRGDALRLLGRAAEAEIAYRHAIERNPDDTRAINGLGHVAAEAGRWRDALDHHDQVIRRAHDDAEAHNGRGIALSGLGEYGAALASFARAQALVPRYADAKTNAGNTLRKMGRFEEALASHDEAIACDPGLIDAHYSRAGVLMDMERFAEALESCERALMLSPGFPLGLMRRGEILNRLGRYTEALEAFDRGLEVPSCPKPYFAELHLMSSYALWELQRTEDALAACDRAVAILPDFAEAWSRRGVILRDLGEPVDAIESYDRALRINPRHAQARNNRCVALGVLGRLDEAVDETRRVLELDPGNSAAYNNLGNWLRRLGRLEEAKSALETAMRLAPDPEEVHLNLAMCLLHAGDFRNGWRAYEARWHTRARPAFMEEMQRPVWRGEENISGRRLHLYAEQGIGDAIQFCRYVPMAVASGAQVSLGVAPALTELFQSLGASVRIVDRKRAPPVFDMHCPLMTLPLAFGTELATIPAAVPYLAAPEERRLRWRERLGARRGFRIGLVWSGNTEHREDGGRSISLETIAPLASAANEVVCLQRELRPEDLPMLALLPGMRFFGHELRDFADTAALIGELDLVISVDTSVLHLAGALGRPAWGLIPFAADWRWLLHREDSPWYPTMRLFRQTALGDWAGVIKRVRDELEPVRRRSETANAA